MALNRAAAIAGIVGTVIAAIGLGWTVFGSGGGSDTAATACSAAIGAGASVSGTVSVSGNCPPKAAGN